MDPIRRSFGQTAPLRPLMSRGEAYFNTINDIDLALVLQRAKRISKIAAAATQITGETLQLADSQIEGFIYSAYRNIDDITARIIPEIGHEEAESLLTSDQTHQTLLLVSKSLKAAQLDRMAKDYRRQGTGFSFTDNGLVLHEDFPLPEGKAAKDIKGCPYTQGNPDKAALFTQSTDNIVRTYTQAYRQGMPANLIAQTFNRRG